MNTAKSLSRISKNIVPNGNDPWAVIVKVNGREVAFTVQRLYAEYSGYKGYKITMENATDDDYRRIIRRSFPSTLKECADFLIELVTNKSN